MDRIQLLGLSGEALERFVTDELEQPRYRAGQIAEWLARGADIDGMTNLSAPLRARLSELAVANPVRIQNAFRSKLDDTEKFLYALPDGNLIEGVLMRYHHGDTLCVSTQVGCRMGCAFCASTLEGRVRDLTAAEILGQVVAVNRHIQAEDPRRRVHNIVLMGSGEPLDNYDNVVSFLRLVNDPKGLNISLRNISLSTCGLVRRMYDFAAEGLPVTLSLSLHAPNDEIRRKIMPVANAYGYEEVLAACKYYVEKTGRRVIFEYALIRDLNSDVRHAEELARRLRGLRCHVNLIPLNDVKERNLAAPDRRTVEAFLKRLELKHISATIRREMGADIEGACGQLRRKVLNDNAEPGTGNA
ncbi:MAG: 23S rRNA (adenine(2503)-C(2))-methyltransferase RlmN [Clostridia bacterium]|nr:23S rRNA (adenine(2503)-C(2))-methyltransferase RlmN [Clostridia bacterium]